VRARDPNEVFWVGHQPRLDRDRNQHTRSAMARVAIQRALASKLAKGKRKSEGEIKCA